MADITKAALDSRFPVDKIIGTYTGSFSLVAPAANATTTVTAGIATNIAETTLFQGIYSYDNGTSWNPFQSRRNHVESVNPAVNPQGELFLYGESTSGTFNVVGQNQRNASSTAGTDYTILYRLALIAKKTQGTIATQPIGTNTFFDSRLNYQKVAVDDVSPMSGVSQTITVAHKLGYIPKIRVYREASGTLRSMGFQLSKKVTIDTDNVYVTIPGSFTGNIHTRIYYDN